MASAVQQLLGPLAAQPQAGASFRLFIGSLLYLKGISDFSDKAEREIEALLLDLKVKKKQIRGESRTKCGSE